MGYREAKPDGKYISYSQFKLFNECPYQYKLKYIDRLIKYEHSIDTAFGDAMHLFCEECAKQLKEAPQQVFLKRFQENLKEISEKVRREKYNSELFREYIQQGLSLTRVFWSEFNRQCDFGFKVFSTEERLFEKIPNSGWNFYGFVDLIIQDLYSGKYYIIDYKTTKSGWHPRKMSDKLTIYQLSLYKHFWAKKHNIPIEDVDTAFLFLKRRGTKNKIKLQMIANGNKRVKNSIELLYNSLASIENKVFVKRLTSCNFCFNKQVCNEQRREP